MKTLLILLCSAMMISACGPTVVPVNGAVPSKLGEGKLGEIILGNPQ